MRISRRTLLRAGASSGLLAVIAACGEGGVRSSASDKNGTTPQPAVQTGVGKLPAPEVTRTKLAMVGDSITKASSKTLTEVLAAQGFTDIDDRGRGQPPHHSRRRQARAAVGREDAVHHDLRSVSTPTCGCIAMGTNDVGQYKTAEEYAGLIDQMLSMPDDVPLVWVDVYNPNQLAGTKLFNECSASRRQARGNTAVALVVRARVRPGREDPARRRLHPNDQGHIGVRRPRVGCAVT